MHELGIIVHVSKTLEGIAVKNQLTEIQSVTLEIGEVSGIVPEFLTDCWNYYRKKNDILKESELKIETLQALTFCEDCEKKYLTVEHGKKCPYCGSDETYLVAGNECMIKEIEAC